MRLLEESYGWQTFNKWENTHTDDLRDSKTSPLVANTLFWEVSSFHELLNHVAFVNSMNKRLILFYRGQTTDRVPIPSLFRENWTCFGTVQKFDITAKNRQMYWLALEEIGSHIYLLFKNKSLQIPRFKGFKNTREIQWAIIQHYGLWPTPLVDITSSLYIAAKFALTGKEKSLSTGFLFVIGMPHLVGSITFNYDEHFTLAKLQSVCPPIAKRPHFQEGFLIGHFPIYSMDDHLIKQSSLINRLVVKFKLINNGDFWDSNFLEIPEEALMPANDILLNYFMEEFGPESRKNPIIKMAEKISNHS